MRFLYLYLENYAGIYNGMHLNTIEIDLSRCMYQTLIIRGENGSGKSTIFKALSVFPDPNDSFLPDLPAKKIISILDHDVVYKITFIHDMKSNGTRDTTKAFITKTINGHEVELNENGNVTSYKDIVFNELSLDPNFFALSQLSSEDRGLATKRPAERKKFVNSIIESLEVYNGIYKAISKQSTSVKAMMDSLVAKIGSLGDVQSLQDNLKLYDDRIEELEKGKEQLLQALADAKAIINTNDPDGTIQLKAVDIKDKQATLYRNNQTAFARYATAMNNHMLIIPEEEHKFLSAQVAAYKAEQDEISIETGKVNTSLVNNSTFLNDVNAQLRTKEDRLATLQDDIAYKADLDAYEGYKAQVETYAGDIAQSGIDPEAFTQDEYILALNTLKDIKHLADLLRSDYDHGVLEQVIAMYTGNGWGNVPLLPIEDELQFMTDYTTISSENHHDAVLLESQIDSLKKLKDRPTTCTDDTCPYISGLVQLAETKPEEKLKSLQAMQEEYDKKYEYMSRELDRKKKINACIGKMKNLIRSITNNRGILLRLPNGGLFASREEFFTKLLAGDDFSYMEKMYSYIDISNEVALYHQCKKNMDEVRKRIDLYESKSEILGELKSEIDDLRAKQCKYTVVVEQEREQLRQLNINANRVSGHLFMLEKGLEIMTGIIENIEQTKTLNREYDTIAETIRRINESKSKIAGIEGDIRYLNMQLSDLRRSRNEVVFSLKRSEEYNQELATLKDRYDKIEIIKHYSSPTKGIQLVFMELYMGKILTLANELLSLLFNGEYVIQPFIINESEFRIPCLGQGYINDDISSMSSSQLTMISMIISFSLLHTSSSKYNILKLDEIDGPLDENNRIMFIDVMNRIMQIMNVEQCIMVSHSSELQVDTSDVILLKNSQLSTDYDRGNIIWRYQ